MLKQTIILILIVVFSLIGCSGKTEHPTTTKPEIELVKKLATPKMTQAIFEKKLDSLKSAYRTPINSAKEFENFKTKSNYLQVIENKDEELLKTYFDYIDEDDFRSYASPTEANGTQYGSKSFVFGDLNNDGLRDCIVTALRSDMYNEIHFFYVFINEGNSFKLMHIANEDDLAGCKNGGWLSRFRYQKIENGFFKGIAFCHFDDAHCCPSLIFKSQANFMDNKLQFHSSQFVMDDPFIMQYRPTPVIDSILVKNTIQ